MTYCQNETTKVSHVQIKENIIAVVNRFQFIEVNNQAVLPELSPEFDIHDDCCSIELCRASVTTTKLKWEQSCHKTGPTYTPGL